MGGVDNPLFVVTNNHMFLGDAMKSDVENVAQKKVAKVDPFIAEIPLLLEKTFLTVGVVKEVEKGESRVSIVPAGGKRLLKNGMKLLVESGAGNGGGFSDSAYVEVGASIAPNAMAVYSKADIIFKIRKPT